MNPERDQPLVPLTTPASPPSMVHSTMRSRRIAFPHSKVIRPKSPSQHSTIRKFYSTRRTTQILEARKLQQIKNSNVLAEEMPDPADQEHFNAMKYGKFELPSIVDHYKRPSPQQIEPAQANQVYCNADPINIRSPPIMGNCAQSPPKHTIVRKFYSRTTTTRMMEDTELEQINSSIEYAGKMPVPSDQEHFNSSSYGNYEEHTLARPLSRCPEQLNKNAFASKEHFNATDYGDFDMHPNVDHFPTSSTNEIICSPAHQGECYTSPINIDSTHIIGNRTEFPPQHNVITKFYSRRRTRQILQDTNLEQINNSINFAGQFPVPADKENFNHMQHGNFEKPLLLDHFTRSPTHFNQSEYPNQSLLPFSMAGTDSCRSTCSADAARLPQYSEKKFFEDVQQGRYQRTGMLALFERTFDKGKQILSDQEDIVGNLRSKFIAHAKCIEQGTPYSLPTSPPGSLVNPELDVQFTDTLSDVCKLFSTFKGEKAKLVQSIGFAGLCSFPVHQSIDLRFYVWILSKVDCRRSAIDLGKNRKIPIHDYDICLITGLPFRGHTVTKEESSPLIKRTNAAQVKKFLSIGKLDAQFTVPYVEYVVRREYNSPRSDEERYGFCVSATVYAISSFLAVQSGEVRFPFEIINSLTDPLQIRSHNWCHLVRKNLISQASYVQNQLSCGKNRIKVGGCPLIAKVLYLDNIDVGVNLVPDYIFPRGSLFSQDIVAKLIIMDTKIDPITKKRQHGNHEFKQRYEVSYTRAVEHETPGVVPLIVDNKRTRDVIQGDALFLHREQEARMEAINSKGRPLTVGEMILKAEGKLMVRKDGKARATYKSKLGGHDNSSGGVFDLNIDLNADPPIDEPVVQPIIQANRRSVLIGKGQKTGVYQDPLSKCILFYQTLDSLRKRDLSCVMWFEHKEPSELKISGQALCDEASRGRPYGRAYTDALGRMLTCDNDNEQAGARKRYKHYMAYSWACKVLGSTESDISQLKEYFVRDFYKYDVDSCDKVVGCVEAAGYRSCYVWDLIEHQVTVLDPVLQSRPTIRIDKIHRLVVKKLTNSLIECIETFFPTRKLSKEEWTVIYRNDISKSCKSQNSSLYAMLYAQFYVGNTMFDRIDSADLSNFRARHLWQVLNMKGNIGAKPMSMSLLHTDGYFTAST